MPFFEFIDPANIPAHTETGVFVPALVFLSYVIASFGAFTALALSRSMVVARNHRLKRVLHICGALALGCGIWSMHFVGMLAYEMDVYQEYDLFFTLFSMVFAVSAAYGALHLVDTERMTAARLWGGAVMVGIAICGMHYTGMEAMRMDGVVYLTPGLFTLSIAIALFASAASIRIMYSLSHRETRHQGLRHSLAALVMGGAICGMHYTGMAAAVFVPFADCRYEPGQDFSELALLVFAATSFVFAIGVFFALYTREQKGLRGNGQDIDVFPISLLSAAATISLGYTAWSGLRGLSRFYTERAGDEVVNDFFRAISGVSIMVSMYIILTVFLLLAVLWIFLFRAVRRWRNELEENRTDMALRFRELQHAQEVAEQANQAKSDFLANMSHELRTPMNSVLGMINLILHDDATTPEHRQMLRIVNRAGNNLLDIVNDILDISRIEARSMTLERIPFRLEETVVQAWDSLLPIASEKGLVMQNDLRLDDAPILVGDPLRLNRILINLIGNAIKYTQAGQVSLRANVESMPHNRICFVCVVSDTGIGIPEDKMNLIFEKFSQADTSITRRFGGTGLGLSITKHLIDMMGGDIHVESRVGEGSTFSFTLMFDRAAPTQVEAEQQREAEQVDIPVERVPVNDARILVAEDHMMNQLYLRKLLEQMGVHSFDLVEDGEAALHAMAQRDYTLVLMDCQMPVKSGYDATRERRALESEVGGHTPIVAMTANAMLGDREKCLKCGMDEYISKPISRAAMLRVLGRWIIFDDHDRQPAHDAGKPQNGIIDLTNLKEIADGNTELEKAFVSAFVTEARRTLKVLHDSCAPEKTDPWCGAAHKLKGGAANIGAVKLSALCREAEQMKTSSAHERQITYGHIKAMLDKVLIQIESAGYKSAE